MAVAGIETDEEGGGFIGSSARGAVSVGIAGGGVNANGSTAAGGKGASVVGFWRASLPSVKETVLSSNEEGGVTGPWLAFGGMGGELAA